MCTKVAYDIVTTTSTKALAAISEDRSEVIDMYNDKITIIKTPNKGESGLREAFKNICSVAKRLVYSNEIE